MQIKSDAKRLPLFKREALRTLIAFIKPANDDIVEEKAEAWEKKLVMLKTEKIEEFFDLIRDGKTMPSDGTIKSILGANLGRFCTGNPQDSQFGSYNEAGIYIRKGTYYTFVDLPWNSWNKKMKSLFEKFQKKSLNNQEIDEWEALKKTKWDCLTLEKIL